MEKRKKKRRAEADKEEEEEEKEEEEKEEDEKEEEEKDPFGQNRRAEADEADDEKSFLKALLAERALKKDMSHVSVFSYIRDETSARNVFTRKIVKP